MEKVLVSDQMGRRIEVPVNPERIVSLVPSQTELLYHLGLDSEVVGQTLFCIHPAVQHARKPKVGGTKNFSIDKIKQLNPDLIIGNKEENDQERIEQLAQLFPVWMSDIQNLSQSIDMIRQVGALVQKSSAAAQMIASIQQSFEQLKKAIHPKRTAYLIWRKPWMAAGGQTFIDDMMSRMGLVNVFSEADSRYPQVTDQQLAQSQPECILLSSEPYPFKHQHIEELLRICPQAQIILVDGELFSWYGSRLTQSVPYFQQLLHQIR